MYDLTSLTLDELREHERVVAKDARRIMLNGKLSGYIALVVDQHLEEIRNLIAIAEGYGDEGPLCCAVAGSCWACE